MNMELMESFVMQYRALPWCTPFSPETTIGTRISRRGVAIPSQAKVEKNDQFSAESDCTNSAARS